MKTIVVGTGTIGAAVKRTLEESGHEVVSVGRKSGDFQADISKPESLLDLFRRVGSFDAVANAAVTYLPNHWSALQIRNGPPRSTPRR